MPSLTTKLLELYLPLVGGVLLGWLLGYILPKEFPAVLGKFLFWVGVPISVVAFLRGADLSGPIWIAPVVAWLAILLGAGLAWVWIHLESNSKQSAQLPVSLSHKPTQGSFLLASMVGNTGYLGFPVTLALVGQQYFGWALFYDMLGTMFGAYGLGVVLAAHFGNNHQSRWQLTQTLLQNPALWSFGFGLAFREAVLPHPMEVTLQKAAWTAVALSLILIGMRLSRLSSWRPRPQVWISLGIKMLLVPLVLGCGLRLLGLHGPPQLVIVLEMAMPPAFATLILGEAFHLDRDLSVTTLAVGSMGFLFMLPLWLWLFR